MPRDLDICMFCLRNDGTFRSEEHILPESLGNTETTLPPGFICDQCNNGRLSVCDQALVQCPPVALLKTVQSIRSKKRKLPRAEFDEAGLFALDDEANIYLRVLDPADVTDGEGSFQVELVQQWSDEGWKRVSRSLLKTGLELLALKQGKEFVLDARLDGIRRAVLDARYSGRLLYTSSNTELNTGISTTHRLFDVAGISRLGLFVELTVFGVCFRTAWPGSSAPAELYAEAERFHEVIFPLKVETAKHEEVRLTIDVTHGSSEVLQEDQMHSAVAVIDTKFPRKHS